MPIRAENKDRYPQDWKAISKRIRVLAGNVCEKCGTPNGELIRRGVTRDKIAVWRLASDSAYMDGYRADNGILEHDTGEDTVGWGQLVKVILTVAHLDHTPENCADDKLRAWCQRCHNVYDMPMRKAGIAARAKSTMAITDLFDDKTRHPCE